MSALATQYADPDLDDAPAAPTEAPPADPAPSSSESSESVDREVSMYDYGDDDDDVDTPSAETTAKDSTSKQVAVTQPSDATEPADKPAEATDATDVVDDDFGDELLSQAEQYGFTKDEARAFGSGKNLTQAMTALDRQLAAFGRQQMAGSAPSEETPHTTPAEVAPKAPGPKAEATADTPPNSAPASNGIEKLNLNLDPDKFDEETIGLLNGINDHYHNLAAQQREEITALRQQMSGVTERHQAEVRQRFASDMDNFFMGLPSELHEEFGATHMASLPPNSPQRSARMRVVEEMNALFVADQALGRRSSVSDLQQRALRVLQGDKLEQVTRQRLIADVDRRRGQSVSRPTSRVSRPKSPEEAAGKFASEFYKARGADKDDSYDGDL